MHGLREEQGCKYVNMFSLWCNYRVEIKFLIIIIIIIYKHLSSSMTASIDAASFISLSQLDNALRIAVSSSVGNSSLSVQIFFFLKQNN